MWYLVVTVKAYHNIWHYTMVLSQIPRSNAPYGYDRDGNALVANPLEQVIIERIKEMDRAGVPMMRIAEALNGEGVPTKKGGKWYASTVKAILTNTLHGAA